MIPIAAKNPPQSTQYRKKRPRLSNFTRAATTHRIPDQNNPKPADTTTLTVVVVNPRRIPRIDDGNEFSKMMNEFGSGQDDKPHRKKPLTHKPQSMTIKQMWMIVVVERRYILPNTTDQLEKREQGYQ
jgi:hypothetical protein